MAIQVFDGLASDAVCTWSSVCTHDSMHARMHDRSCTRPCIPVALGGQVPALPHATCRFAARVLIPHLLRAALVLCQPHLTKQLSRRTRDALTVHVLQPPAWLARVIAVIHMGSHSRCCATWRTWAVSVALKTFEIPGTVPVRIAITLTRTAWASRRATVPIAVPNRPLRLACELTRRVPFPAACGTNVAPFGALASLGNTRRRVAKVVITAADIDMHVLCPSVSTFVAVPHDTTWACARASLVGAMLPLGRRQTCQPVLQIRPAAALGRHLKLANECFAHRICAV